MVVRFSIHRRRNSSSAAITTPFLLKLSLLLFNSTYAHASSITRGGFEQNSIPSSSINQDQSPAISANLPITPLQLLDSKSTIPDVFKRQGNDTAAEQVQAGSVGRVGNIVDLTICILSIIGALTIIYPFIVNKRGRKLRHALIVGLATSDLVAR